MFDQVNNNLIADNTKFPYDGKRNPKKHIKSPRLPGTKHAWMFQGSSVVSEDLHLFVDFHSLTKGVYLFGKIPDTIRWLQWVGIDPRWRQLTGSSTARHL